MDFHNATVLGVNQESVFLGSRTARLKTIKTFSIDGFIDSREFNEDMLGVRQTIDQIVHEISTVSGPKAQSQNLIEEIRVNDISLGHGKITNLNYKASSEVFENQVLFGSYSATIEVYIEGSISEIFKLPKGSIDDKFSLEFLNDLTESFSFSLSEDGSYSCNHSLGFSFLQNSKNSDFVKISKALAKEIFERTPLDFNGLIEGHFGDVSSSGKRFFTETYDLESNQFNFSKKYDVYQKDGGTYSLTSKTSFAFDDNGIIKITETGTLKDKNLNMIDALASLENELNNNSFVRCNKVYNAYKNIFSQNTNFLKNSPTEISKTTDNNSSILEYSISYTDDKSFDNVSYFEELQLQSETSDDSVTSISVNLSRVYANGKEENFRFNDSFPSFSIKARAEAQDYYSRNNNLLPLNLINSSISFPNFGKKIESSFSFTNDKKIFPSNLINWKGLLGGVEVVSQEEITIQDEIGVVSLQEYVIPNGVEQAEADRAVALRLVKPNNAPNAWKTLIHEHGQTTLAKKTITGSFKLKRTKSNGVAVNNFIDINLFKENLSSFILLALDELLILLRNDYIDKNLPSVYQQEFFISGVSYDFNSDGEVNLSLTAEYPMIRVQNDPLIYT